MQYRHDILKDYSDFASGRVLYNAKSATNFPVRLAHEIFNRSLSYLDKKKDLIVYDQCCGGAYLLTTIAFLNYSNIAQIKASDIDTVTLELATKNLSLLNKGE